MTESLDRKWRFESRNNGFELITPLWFYPDLDCSSCVDDAWGARILECEPGWGRVLKRPCTTEEHAKLAAFDAIVAARAKP